MQFGQKPEWDSVDALFYDQFSTGLPGDVQFYVEEAIKAGSPVLELGCGTGRILIPVAQAGVDIVGFDRAPRMLEITRRKVSELSQNIQNRIELVEGDMRALMLERQFNLVMIPYRAFLHLLTPEDQKQVLWRIREHLVDGGRLVMNNEDPSLETSVREMAHPEPYLGKHSDFVRPDNGNRVIVWNSIRYNPTTQVHSEDRIFEEVDGDGGVIGRTYTTLVYRDLFRYEAQNLLELCGFEVEALYGDFQRGPFRYSKEQVWVARKK
jgi:ubiquinone/menaquinone biosynthesis C-methylase UbiE